MGDNLTKVDFGVKYNQSGLVDRYSTGWLDIRMVGENVTELSSHNLAENNTLFARMLEIFEYIGENNIINLANLFANCTSLQKVEFINIEGANNAAGMFLNCFSLQVTPPLDYSKFINTLMMFRNCYSLTDASNVVINIDLRKGNTTIASMFDTCRALVVPPEINLVSSDGNYLVATEKNVC